MGLGGWWSPAFGECASLPWLVVEVGELAVAVSGDAAAGVAVAAGAAGVGQVVQVCVAPLLEYSTFVDASSLRWAARG